MLVVLEGGGLELASCPDQLVMFGGLFVGGGLSVKGGGLAAEGEGVRGRGPSGGAE